MADIGYVKTLLNRLPSEQRTPLEEAFTYVMKQARLGNNTKAENLLWYLKESTTASVANTEFSIDHGLGYAPTKLIPILPLDVANAQIVPLTVSRVADARRVYLKSSSTSTLFQVYLE